MRNLWGVSGVALCALIGAADAQQFPPQPVPPQQLPQQAPQPTQPRRTPPPPPAAQPDGGKIAQPVATFKGLDKITGLTRPFDVGVDETVQFGALQVTPRVCYTRPATMAQQTSAFVEIDEVTLDNQVRRIFTGWMFADSPGLHAVEHPVYDIWLTDCKASSPDVKAPRKP